MDDGQRPQTQRFWMVYTIVRTLCNLSSCLPWKRGYKSLSNQCSRGSGLNLVYVTCYCDSKFVYYILTSAASIVTTLQAYITKLTSSIHSSEKENWVSLSKSEGYAFTYDNFSWPNISWARGVRVTEPRNSLNYARPSRDTATGIQMTLCKSTDIGPREQNSIFDSTWNSLLVKYFPC
jgi:hypothetical protein